MKAVQRKRVFPNARTLARVREPDGEVDRAKYQLCQFIATYQREHGLLQKDIARQIGVDESRISDILRGRIAGFTLDRMIGYAKKLHPGLRVRVIAA